MIRNDTEYQQAIRRLGEERARLEEHARRLRDSGLSPDEVKHALEPLQSFHLLMHDEIDEYDRAKRGEIPEMSNLHGIGVALISCRIAAGVTQRELAQKLSVHESQVSRDERNEYHGVSVEKAARILDTLNADLRCTFLRRASGTASPRAPEAPAFVQEPTEPNAAASPAPEAVWVEEKRETKLGFLDNPATSRRAGRESATTSRTTKRAA